MSDVMVLTRAELDELLNNPGERPDTHPLPNIYFSLDKEMQEYVYDNLPPLHRGYIKCHDPEFDFSWIAIYENEVEWWYSELSAVCVDRNLPLDYVMEHSSKDWEFSVLASHPDFRLSMVKTHKEKYWDYGILFENFPYSSNKDNYCDLQICTIERTFDIKIPPFFRVESLYHHPDIDCGKKSYYVDGCEEKLLESTYIEYVPLTNGIKCIFIVFS